MYPTISEYNTDILKYGSGVFKTLDNYDFISSRSLPVKIFSYGNGSYAVVFKAKHNNTFFAIRCFISANYEVFWRYQRIDAYLKQLNESWVTRFDYLDDEIKIKGNSFPIVKMEWVEGQLLNTYITNNLYDNNALDKLQKAIVALSENLEKHKISHGDIQCGNVIVQGDSNNPVIRLIDYDGMYIPEFENMQCLERGRTEFQHPFRTQMKFDEKIDRFSFWVIIAGLEALKFNKDLWQISTQGGYNTLDNVLFIGADFSNFNQSTLVNRLFALNEVSVNFYLNKLQSFCFSASLNIEKPDLYVGEPMNPIVSKINLTKPNLDVITIKSFPNGANVLNQSAVKLGQTPLSIKKETVINQRIILSYGTRVQTFFINNDTTEIFHQFAEPAVINSFQPTIIRPEDEENDYTVLANSHPIVDPDKNSNMTTFIWVGIIIVAGIFISYFLTKREATATSYTTAVDSTSMLKPDTATTIKDETVAIAAPVSDNTLFELKDENGNTPEEVVRAFFYDLDNHSYTEAFNRSYNPVWEKNGLDWFISDAEFGGISSITIQSIANNGASVNEVSFSVTFTQNHLYDGKQCFVQLITLKKINIFDNKNTWVITDASNMVVPYACE